MRNGLLMLSMVAWMLMAGCSSKSQEKAVLKYEKNKEYHKQLGKTESTELTNGLTSRAVFTATYLFTPTEDKNDTRDEVFIVNLYFNDQEVLYEDDDFNLSIAANISQKKQKYKEAKSVKKLSANDPLLKNISFVSEWSQYYLVTFPHMKKNNFYLLFQSDFHGHGDLNFAKVSKYVLRKEIF